VQQSEPPKSTEPLEAPPEIEAVQQPEPAPETDPIQHPEPAPETNAIQQPEEYYQTGSFPTTQIEISSISQNLRKGFNPEYKATTRNGSHSTARRYSKA
jgi:hypothetical protein